MVNVRLCYIFLLFSESLWFINDCNNSSFVQYSHLVFLSSDSKDEIYNPDSQVGAYHENFTCHYSNFDSENLEKN